MEWPSRGPVAGMPRISRQPKALKPDQTLASRKCTILEVPILFQATIRWSDSLVSVLLVLCKSDEADWTETDGFSVLLAGDTRSHRRQDSMTMEQKCHSCRPLHIKQ